MAKGGYYAVAKGVREGIFDSWDEAKKLVIGFPGAEHKKFSTKLEAKNYLIEHGSSAAHRTVSACGNNGVESVNSHSTVQRQSAQDDRDDIVEAPGGESLDMPDLSKFSISEPAQIKSEAVQPALSAQEDKPKGARTLINGLWYSERAPSLTAEPPPIPQHEDALAAFCAGSAPRNGQTDCQAGYACLFPLHKDLNVASPVENDQSTNNRADYLGALAAMKHANKKDPACEQVLYIFSSNLTLIRSITKWIDDWLDNNWCKYNGKPVKNRDILEQMLTEQGKRRIMWRHVKAHSGLLDDWESEWHEKASQEAKRVAGQVRA